MLHNECYARSLPSKLDLPLHFPPPNLAYFPDSAGNPDEIPGIQFLPPNFRDWGDSAVMVFISSPFLLDVFKVSIAKALEHEIIPFSSF